jgi:hypothetical protein
MLRYSYPNLTGALGNSCLCCSSHKVCALSSVLFIPALFLRPVNASRRLLCRLSSLRRKVSIISSASPSGRPRSNLAATNMRAWTLVILTFYAAFVFALNNINVPAGATTLDASAGQPLTLTWNDPSSGTVTIKLQQAPITPESGLVLACISNLAQFPASCCKEPPLA